MTLPTLSLALLISFLIGAAYHFLRGGNGWKLILYFVMSALGFGAAQWLGRWLGWSMYRFGALEVGLGVIGSLLFLMFGEWLSLIEPNEKSGV